MLGRRALRKAEQRVAGALNRATGALALGFFGVIASCLADSQALQVAIQVATLVACALVLRTGGDELGLTATGKGVDYARAVGVAVVGLAISAGYALLLNWLLGADRRVPEAARPLALLLVGFALLPGMLEELLCRGVLFAAAMRLGGGGAVAVVITAILFAFLHGLNGAYLLELPHRFVMGLLLGWLRLRSRSIGPCVVAHVLHNALAIVLFA